MTRRGFLFALPVLALGSCAKPAGDPVVRVLEEIARAATRRDGDAMLARLAPSFTGEGGLSHADTAAELRRLFTLYDSVEVGLADIVVERPADGAAVARFRASFAGKPKSIGGLAGMLPDAERLRFEVSLGETGGAWRVSSARWERLAQP